MKSTMAARSVSESPADFASRKKNSVSTTVCILFTIREKRMRVKQYLQRWKGIPLRAAAEDSAP
jgi:hypothetical protein